MRGPEERVPEEPEEVPKGAAEDRRLVLAAREGDRDAFGELVRKYAPVVRALTASRLRRTEDAEDAAQDVFLLAFRRLDRLDRPERFAGWISRIAVNRALELHRRAGRRPGSSLEALPGEPAAPAPEPAPMERTEVADEMLAHLGTLDERTQVTLALRFREGLAVKDVALRLGENPPATAMRISRALRRLRARLEGGGAR